jgi:hypothetical protein
MFGALVVLDLLLAGPAVAGGLLGVLSVRRHIREELEVRRRARAEERAPLHLGPDSVLASDAERERTVGLIARAIGEARLGIDEGTDRIDAIWGAQRRNELVELVADLPQAPEPVRRKLGAGAVSALVLSLGATAVQGVLGLWELWPVAVGLCLLLAFGSRRSPGR